MSSRRDPEYDDWPVQGRESTDVRYVGVPGAGGAAGVPSATTASVFYDADEHTLFSAEIDEENQQIVPTDDDQVDIDPEETLGEALERLGEETGWDSLSQFAQDHLEDDE